MAEYAAMPVLDAWYSMLEMEALRARRMNAHAPSMVTIDYAGKAVNHRLQ
jgi:hypothetical protein